MPPFDKAFAALIRDLDQRRTARLDAGHGHQRVRPHAEDQPATTAATTGRKVFSVVLAGGGIKSGHDLRLVRRDRRGAGSATRWSSRTWPTTIYHQLGINADKELMAPGNRPIDIVAAGRSWTDCWLRPLVVGTARHPTRRTPRAPARMYSGNEPYSLARYSGRGLG